MNKPSKALVLVAGVLSLLTALFMILMAGLMYALETPATTCLLMGSFSAVPLLVVVACFVPKRRTIALRILGFLIFLLCSATLIQTFLGEVLENGPRGRRIGMLVTIIIGSGLMAWKGRWPGTDEDVTEVEGATPA